ncbi:hypothetical protein PINS_up004962 [Pythium insidiosum]|nr:hypothetical protein PINS_up004962 [Pythium insidiosum]
MATKSLATDEAVYQKHVDVYEPAIGQPVMHMTHDGYTAPRAVPAPVGNVVIVDLPTDEPTPKCAWLRWTLLLFPYHFLNCVVGCVGFALSLTDVIVSVCLLPIFFIGVYTHRFFLYPTYALSVLDALLANLISPKRDRIHVLDPETTAYLPPATSPTVATASKDTVLRVSPALLRFSSRSNVAITYYLTIKFALGIMSVVAVCLPFIAFASDIVARSTDSHTYVLGWEVHDFNFDTHPVLFTLTAIGLVIGGVLAMHAVGAMSRALTRCVCCERLQPAPPHAPVATIQA